MCRFVTPEVPIFDRFSKFIFFLPRIGELYVVAIRKITMFYLLSKHVQVNYKLNELLWMIKFSPTQVVSKIK